MATATAQYHLPRPDNDPTSLASYARGLTIGDLDFKDTRYPTVGSSSMNNRRGSAIPFGPRDLSGWDGATEAARRISSDPSGINGHSAVVPPRKEIDSEEELQPGVLNGMAMGQQQGQPSKLEAVVQYALPADTTRRVVERYSVDENRIMSRTANRPHLSSPQPEEDITASPHQQGVGRPTSPERSNFMLPTSPRHPSLLPTAAASIPEAPYAPIIPLSASPSYNPAATLGIPVPLFSSPRAYAQQPTYITLSSAPNPLQPVYLPNPLQPQEEVCVECAMRDQDMADVDVTSPGVWDRESDVLYDDLVRREEEEHSDIISSESHKSNRPRAKGGKLTESNLKVWMTMNPREPQARQQTLQLYLKTQRALLEAETLAHARAMQESRQLDNRMRDAYTQLRRSQYDMGRNGGLPDDIGGVRIITPRSPSGTGLGLHGYSHSRDVTLLENGLIVEHVNVRKEEREQRERKRKEEKRERSRARKSSRGSVHSVRSLATPITDSGLGLQPHTRYSASNTTRPTSAMTTYDRPPSFPQAHSQASFSDVHSLGSGSPRQRFFGFRNLSSGWRSRDSLAPSGMSGSMVDMHVALQREGYEQRVQSPIDLGSKAPSLLQNQAWPRTEDPSQVKLQEVPKKKKKGLSKIWDTLTGSKNKGSSSGGKSVAQTWPFDRTEEDLPLAPPPPLSYLMERRPGEHNTPGPRQSTVSLPSTASPKNLLSSPAVSPGTPPSSVLPSPSSSRPSNADPEIMGETRKHSWNPDEQERADPPAEEGRNLLAKQGSLHQVTSEPDTQRPQQEPPSLPSSPIVPQSSSAIRPQSMLMREKSLPPLPDESNLYPPADQPNSQPQMVYSYDHRQIPPGASAPVQDLAAPRTPFRIDEDRRQSFSGLISRPNFTSQTLPSKGLYAQELRPPANQYSEFGTSRRSLGYLEHIQEKEPELMPTMPSKRKSKFGLPSFLGRKSQTYDNTLLSNDYSAARRSTSDAHDITSSGGYATPGLRYNIGPRMSVMSRKAIEELVEQDPTFVAYRYPSSDQPVDLLR